MRRAKTVITTPYPTEKMVAAEMKISKKRLREVRAILDDITSNRKVGTAAMAWMGADGVVPRRRTKSSSGSSTLKARSLAARKRNTKAVKRKMK